MTPGIRIVASLAVFAFVGSSWARDPMKPSTASPPASRPASLDPPSAVSLSQQQEEIVAIATDVAKQCTATLERWLTNKELTHERLFNFFYVPIPNTDPPKFTTDYDKLSDRDILPIEEAALAKSPVFQYVILVDKNGYVPTHNLRYSQPLTGNKASDIVNNRTKTLYIDRTGIGAARNQAPFLFQEYAGESGEVLMDVSVPIFVQGAHWGAIRIGYRPADRR